ncbi:phosphate ABC transporter permease subunit PstC [Fluviispira multicolorata]|uniref:phosphate ABC transporter permease subunit PstC n=1 Tax=Fluviispira multicolorata TaxID=2654512 RepID=UPI001B86A8F9|nr:phosphate ABC transporter permease subunit PstC [Fluviispira multicolorata]
MGDLVFSNLTKAFSWLAFLLLICVLLSLIVASAPALHAFGFHFLLSDSWDPVNGDFGALSAISGTLMTSVIAMFIGVPLSVGIAVFISEISQGKISKTVRTLIDLMAGIPSIIYGMWGLLVLAPFLSNYVQPQISDAVENIPILEDLFGGPPLGIGIFTAGLILAIMIIPYISSTLIDMFRSVPPVLKEAAYGIGATRFEVVRKVIFPYVRKGMIGSLMLGLGRALGETMAVTFVIGNSKQLTSSLFMPGTTISASIANEFNEATGRLYPASLLELGVILFVLSCLILGFARLFLLRINKKSEGAKI